jgi:hypothetical protein
MTLPVLTGWKSAWSLRYWDFLTRSASKARQLDQLTVVASAVFFLMICVLRNGELAASGYSITAAAVLLTWSVRGNYLHPCFLFATPWTLILFVSTLRISEYSRPIGAETQLLVSGVIWLAVLVASAANLRPIASLSATSTVYYSRRNFYVILGLLLTLTAANVALAGYIRCCEGLGAAARTTWTSACREFMASTTPLRMSSPSPASFCTSFRGNARICMAYSWYWPSSWFS